MISNHHQFIEAIRNRKLIGIVYDSPADGGTVDRECAPLDYGAELGAGDTLNRYWIWDPAARPAGANPLGLLPDQIVSVAILGRQFDPAQLGIVERPWFVLRDWGKHRELTDPLGEAPGATG